MLRDVVRRRRRRRRRYAHAPVIHAASHFTMRKELHGFLFSMHACDPVPIVMGLRLAAPPLKRHGIYLIALLRRTRIWIQNLLEFRGV